MSDTEYKQNNVSAVVWRWQDPVDTSHPQHNRKSHIIKGLIGLCIGFGFASFLYFKQHHVIAPIVIATISSIIGICALFIPAAFARIDSFFNKAGHVVGQGLAYVLLVPLFFLFFVPAHIIMSIMGKDKLKLKYPSAEPTFWEPRAKVEDIAYYRRQY
jgi:hypothetical protein